ncbi:MAG: hypothetical protein ABIJ09_00510 [Pseudomonadota bacterium]
MGLLGFLGIGGTPEEQIERHLKKVKQVYAQPEYRRDAMDGLLKMATPESLGALCKRFGVVCNSAYWDEEEKKWLVDTFVELGQTAVPSLQKYVRDEEHVNYPIRALARILSDEDLTAFLLEALQGRKPEDHRSSRGKMEIIDHLGHRPATDALVQIILPYLRDHSDDVIHKSIEVLQDWRRHDVAGPLFALVYDEGMSARIQRRAAEAVVSLDLSSDEDLPSLPDAVAEDYSIEGRTLVRNRPARSDA